jgi:hypothetical protein
MVAVRRSWREREKQLCLRLQYRWPPKLDAWEAWIAELNGPQEAQLTEMNVRHGLTEHRALPPADARRQLPRARDPWRAWMRGLHLERGASDHEFDRWFMRTLVELHAIDTSGPMSPITTRKL